MNGTVVASAKLCTFFESEERLGRQLQTRQQASEVAVVCAYIKKWGCCVPEHFAGNVSQALHPLTS